MLLCTTQIVSTCYHDNYHLFTLPHYAYSAQLSLPDADFDGLFLNLAILDIADIFHGFGNLRRCLDSVADTRMYKLAHRQLKLR